MQRVRVTANKLNVRQTPAADGVVVGVLDLGDVVEHTGTSADGYWFRVSRAGLGGWASHKYLAAVVEAPAVPASEYPWMAIAAAELGVAEVLGAQANPRIVEYLRSTTLDQALAATDETPWCSAFANWCVEKAGYAGTDSAWARNWLNWGQPLAQPKVGCVTVFTRDVSSGHVGFYVSETATHITVLGGNQGNRVTVAAFPKALFLGHRGPAA